TGPRRAVRVRADAPAPPGDQRAAGQRRVHRPGPPRRLPPGGVLTPDALHRRSMARPPTLGPHPGDAPAPLTPPDGGALPAGPCRPLFRTVPGRFHGDRDDDPT